MRGETQAHLVAGDDGHYYVVKFTNNPRGCRILVNELVACLLLHELGVLTPEVAFIRVDEQFRSENPAGHLVTAAGNEPFSVGIHLGTRYPAGGSPIYDFLPDPILPRVDNLSHFLGALVFDKWTANAGERQAIFFRRTVVPRPNHLESKWIVEMIDHGRAFQGKEWTFRDLPEQGLYRQAIVYNPTGSFDDAQVWIDKASRITDGRLDCIRRFVPPAWIEGEEREFAHLLERLADRRSRVAELTEQSLAWGAARTAGRSFQPMDAPDANACGRAREMKN